MEKYKLDLYLSVRSVIFVLMSAAGLSHEGRDSFLCEGGQDRGFQWSYQQTHCRQFMLHISVVYGTYISTHSSIYNLKPDSPLE